MPMTFWSSFNKVSSKFEPINPATPVIIHVRGASTRSFFSFSYAVIGVLRFIDRLPHIQIPSHACRKVYKYCEGPRSLGFSAALSRVPYRGHEIGSIQ